MAVGPDFSAVTEKISGFVLQAREKLKDLESTKIYENIPSPGDLRKYEVIFAKYKEAIEVYGDICKALATAVDAEISIRNMLQALGKREGRGDTVMYRMYKETLSGCKEDVSSVIAALRHHKDGCEGVINFYKAAQFLTSAGW